ncbi:MAG: TIGR04283 family arsenosugar biosynthesis glycosyltransferase, partial [Methylococcales bacterium]
MSHLSIIIPTLNEIGTLPLLLDQLGKQQAIDLEVIVVDGGSNDGTLDSVSNPGILLVETTPGRGSQLNVGASQASSPYFLFLHADSRLTSPNQLAAAVKDLETAQKCYDHHRVAGHFRLEFQRDHPGSNLAFRYYEEKSALNRMECTNGDQGFLMSRLFFQELGGFDESLWFLEDQRLAENIRSAGKWITLSGCLVTSARRFEREGLGRRMILSALIMNFHHIGLMEFFQRSGAIYRNQDRTGILQLAPIFRLINDLNRDAGRSVALQRWLATGRYVRGHAWQIFFFFDVAFQSLFKTKGRGFL